MGYNDGSRHKCFLCSEEYYSEERLQFHFVHLHMDWIVEEGPPHNEGTTPDDSIVCAASNLSLHAYLYSLIRLKGPFCCTVCGRLFYSYTAFWIHMLHLHFLTKAFRCTITGCAKTYTSPSMFEIHARNHPQPPGLKLNYVNSSIYSVWADEREERKLAMSVYNSEMKLTPLMECVTATDPAFCPTSQLKPSGAI